MRSATVALGVLLAWALIAFVSVRGISRPFGNGDEVVYAEGVREMVDSGDYLTLSWLDHPVLERPTTAFLVPALLSRFIDGEAGLRLFAVVCSLATVLVCYRLARDLDLGRDGAAVAALMLAGIPSFHLFSRSLLTDPPFVLATTAALWATVRALRDPRWLWRAAAAVGAAFAIKSVAGALPLVVLLPWWVVVARRLPARRRVAPALAFVALAAPYFIASAWVHGADFWHEHFVRTVVDRAQGELAMGMGGPLAYVIYTWQAAGPEIAVPMAAGVVAAAVMAVRDRDSRLGVVASFAVGLFVLLSLVGTRLPHYLLPIYPAVAVTMAVAVDALRRAVGASPLARAVPVALALCVFALGVSRPPEEAFMPDANAERMGYVLAQLPGDEPVYTLDWYAPVLAYYGERRWVLLTTSEQLFERLHSLDHFRAAGAVQQVPPWPRGPGPALIAGRREQVARIPGYEREMASSGDYVLGRVWPTPR